MITCKIAADSINPAGDRITTGVWTYPRFIHSEVMTHQNVDLHAILANKPEWIKL